MLTNMLTGLVSRVRAIVYGILGVTINGPVWLRNVEISRDWGSIVLHGGVALDRGVVLQGSGAPVEGKITIGASTYINRYTIIDAHRHVHIGSNCLIGPHCYITDGNHGIQRGTSITSQPIEVNPVDIENDVWISAHVTVLPGVRIGNGAVVAAGSVVNRDVEANSIVAGVPAKRVRDRSDA